MASNQSGVKSGRSSGRGSARAKKGTPRGKKGIKTLGGPPPGDEETPIIITGGSIKVLFAPDFEDEAAPAVKVKKAKHPNASARFTRVIISLGKLKDDGSNIINRFPENGIDLNKGCYIYIFSA